MSESSCNHRPPTPPEKAGSTIKMVREKMKQIEWLLRFLRWRDAHISERLLILVLAFITGIACSVATALLKSVIEWIQEIVIELNEVTQFNYLYLVTPIIGVLLSGLFVKYIVRQDISHGITKILLALSQGKSRLKPHNVWTSLVASSVTIGLGGSVGAEAPIVLTGSAIGSNIGRFFRLEQGNLMLLVGCGAAGAVSGIFKAPITGLVFVIEVLMMDLTLTSVMPLLVTSVTATCMSYAFFGMEAMFPYNGEQPFILEQIPLVLLLGVSCGVIAIYFIKTSVKLEYYLKSLSYPVRFNVCVLLLSLLIFILPPLYGEGYRTISTLISGVDVIKTMGGSFFELSSAPWSIFPLFLGIIIFCKVIATVATNAGGGSGGVFAPSLFTGAIIGYLFSYMYNKIGGIPFLPTDNFTLLGMAGVMAGVMHAPLTGTFLIAELTGGYNLFIPLLLVSVMSYGVSRFFLSHNIYALRLAAEGKLVTHKKDQAVLTLMDIEQVLETNFNCLTPHMTLGEVVQTFSQSETTRNVMPVLEEDGYMVGMVLLDNIRNIMFRPELYEKMFVSTFMVVPSTRITTTMSMDSVMRAFEESKQWNLPVETPEGKYLGFVSKSKIFNTYRDVLNAHFSGD